jgi:O-antigen/teichoic acid export membrane protein
MSFPTRGLGRDGVGSNALSVVLARLLVPVLNIALVVAIARTGGAAALGAYTLIVTMYQLCENLKSLGLTTLLVREVSKDPAQAMPYHAVLLRIGYWGSLWTGALLCAVMLRSSPFSTELLFSTIIMCLGLLPSAQVLANDALFLALGRAKLSLYIALLENGVRLAASLISLLVFHSGILQLAAIYAVTRLLAAAAGAFARRQLQLGPSRFDPALNREALRAAPAFLSVFIAPLILFRMDVLFLGLLTGEKETGIYSAALRLITVAMIVPDGIMSTVFSHFSKLVGSLDMVALRQWIQRMLFLMVGLMTAAAATTHFAASSVLPFLFGKKFLPSVPVLQILIWMPVFFTAARVLGDSLVSCGKQSTVAKIVWSTLGVSVLLYLLLIPKFKAEGAAYAFLLSSCVLFLLSAIPATIKLQLPGAPAKFQLTGAGTLAGLLAPALTGMIVLLRPQSAWLNFVALIGAAILIYPTIREVVIGRSASLAFSSVS